MKNMLVNVPIPITKKLKMPKSSLLFLFTAKRKAAIIRTAKLAI